MGASQRVTPIAQLQHLILRPNGGLQQAGPLNRTVGSSTSGRARFTIKKGAKQERCPTFYAKITACAK